MTVTNYSGSPLASPNNLKNLSACKPDSVSSSIALAQEDNGYHLSGPDIAIGILLPTLRHRTSRPQAPVYVALQHTRFTQFSITAKIRELLPHVFTLTPLLSCSFLSG